MEDQSSHKNALASINLKLLQAFLTVAEQGSFRGAALELNRSHSAVSAQVSQLEVQLGAVLFQRTTRTVKLTQEGLELLDCARTALNDLNQGIQRLREASDLRSKRVSLACSSSIASEYLPKLLAEFVYDNPQVSVTVKELTSHDLMTSLDKGEVDFALGPLSDEKRFSYETILQESLFAIVPAHLIENQKRIAFSELAKLPLLLSTSATAMRRLLEDAAQKSGFELVSRYQFIQATTIIAMAEAGLGAAILPRTSLRNVTQRDRVRIMEIIEPKLERYMAIITKRNSRPSMVSLKLMDRVRKALNTKDV